ncbi:hypothetical protein IRT38_01415 (plasmid) [Acinetobacter sp. SK-43]|uniref:hypothetical protein n=1 Tax=Pseudomonadota TaxID=1224 RepID=UPI0012C6BA55|nr:MULTISPECIES: hypothetical protein [Pseudomonadota]MBF4454076.1 hypothetical protein [Acinetobacter sp. SK-43]MPS92729.1 hypothetical protein [Comamonas sp.]
MLACYNNSGYLFFCIISEEVFNEDVKAAANGDCEPVHQAQLSELVAAMKHCRDPEEYQQMLEVYSQLSSESFPHPSVQDVRKEMSNTRDPEECARLVSWHDSLINPNNA